MDRTRFEQLALEHLDAVHRMAMHLARDPDLAEDLVQETYLKAFRSADTFKEPSPSAVAPGTEQTQSGGMRPWLFTILHHTFYSRVKRDGRAPMPVDDFHDADERARIPDQPPPAWDLASLDWEHVDGRLKAAIDALPPDQRDVLLLWGVEGMKYREIADVTGVPIGTVMSRLHRARKTLAESMEAFAGELGFHRRRSSSGDPPGKSA